jgi:hypothetical protein
MGKEHCGKEECFTGCISKEVEDGSLLTVTLECISLDLKRRVR